MNPDKELAEATAVAVLHEADAVEETPDLNIKAAGKLPPPSLDRLEASLEDQAYDVSNPSAILQKTDEKLKHQHHDSVLYLAYGSNLCKETFQGMRGIRPLSAVNVVVPELDMTFDLAAMPYHEPCFANVRFNRRNGGATAKQSLSQQETKGMSPWTKGLVGVVYEITTKDYARIMATEGAGSAYKDIVISCYPLTNEVSAGQDDKSSPVRQVEIVPSPPQSSPFRAHTLFCAVPYPDDHRESSNVNSHDHKPATPSPPYARPNPGYGQPSPRYLKLIRDGAAEHNLPIEYQRYLSSLQPYRPITVRQKIGQWIFKNFWWRLVHKIMLLNRTFADDHGRASPWTSRITLAAFRTVWLSYDLFYFHLFGDGERSSSNGV